MKVVIQRVSSATVEVAGVIIAAIGPGLLVFAGIGHADTSDDIAWISRKITGLRVFDDADKIPNLSARETGSQILLVSQFTLQASVKKGNRPSYIDAAKPEVALPIYEDLIRRLEIDLGKAIQTGQFGADMKVALVNDGPLTIIIDSKEKM